LKNSIANRQKPIANNSKGKPMYTLATLHQLRQRLGLASADTADDPRLLDALQAATAHIEQSANRRFCPRIATIGHTIGKDRTELLLVDDLLELTALTDGDGSVIPLSDVMLIPDSDEPAGALKLTDGRVFTWEETPEQAVTVTGVWGWHNRWSSAWLNSADTVQNNPLNASATALTVADADGADGNNQLPRFQVGQLLKIESEYLRVLAVNTATNVLTVQRGVNGTTAASHAQNTAISIYQPPLEVQILALRWAAWLYKEPDNRAAASALPSSLTAALNPFRRLGVSA
jgi:hypothetical protein